MDMRIIIQNIHISQRIFSFAKENNVFYGIFMSVILGYRMRHSRNRLILGLHTIACGRLLDRHLDRCHRHRLRVWLATGHAAAAYHPVNNR